MVAHADSKTGSAEKESKLWSAGARDWADVQEGLTAPLYKAVIHALNIGPGVSVLDVGCGAGGFALLAAQQGAKVSGFDATAALLEIARARTPNGDFSRGDMEQLPYADNTFDAVTGFNSFQYAADPVNALKEARRVAKDGAPVTVALWGKSEDCEAAAYLLALKPLLPPPPPGAPGPFALSQEGALEALVEKAGLKPETTETVDCNWEYPDLDTALRGMLSAGPAHRAVLAAGEKEVRDAVTRAIEPFKTASGGYRLENKFIYMVTRA